MNPENSGKYLQNNLLNRFWSRVTILDANSCWPWDKPTHKFGYGQIKIGEKLETSHRVAYKDCVGPIPPGMVIRHKCDNPICVNPNHLEIGTQKDNLNDATIRGRLDRGKRYRDYWMRLQAEKKAKL